MSGLKELVCKKYIVTNISETRAVLRDGKRELTVPITMVDKVAYIDVRVGIYGTSAPIGLFDIITASTTWPGMGEICEITRRDGKTTLVSPGYKLLVENECALMKMVHQMNPAVGVELPSTITLFDLDELEAKQMTALEQSTATKEPTVPARDNSSRLRVFRTPDDTQALQSAFPRLFRTERTCGVHYLVEDATGVKFAPGTTFIIPTGDTDLTRMVTTTRPFTEVIDLGVGVLTTQLHDGLLYSSVAASAVTCNVTPPPVRLFGFYVGTTLTQLAAYDTIPVRHMDLIDPKYIVTHLPTIPPYNDPTTVKVKLRGTVVETITSIADIDASQLFAKLVIDKAIDIGVNGYVIKCPSGVLTLKTGTTIILNTDPAKEPISGVLMG